MNVETTHSSEKADNARTLIYVVDDEPMLLELASVILDPLGYRLKTFRDPDLALKSYLAASPQPDLLITDYAMHEMNGLALMEACRKLHPRLKVLLISGTVDETIYRNSKTRPDRFLAKPYQARQLVDLVRELLAEAARSKNPH